MSPSQLASVFFALLTGCASIASSPTLELAILGGDAWIFDKLISGQAAQSCEQIQLLPPTVDGDYRNHLRVHDALGRLDVTPATFRVEDGQPREIDLATEHPRWVDRAVIYGVVPYFFGSAGFADITKRLDEIAALGATAIWLSPVTEAPADDFGYAVADHFRLRSEFGTEEDFKARIERDATDEVPTYFDWDNLKNLNYDNPEVQNYILAASSYWIKQFDIDGFRVDAGWGVRQRAPEFWRRWRTELKRIKPDIFLLAEAPARDLFYLRNGFDAAYDWTDNLGEWAWKEVFPDDQPVDLEALRAAHPTGATSSLWGLASAVRQLQ